MYWKNPVRAWRETKKRYRWLRKRGKLVSWTRIETAAETFSWQKRYYVGIVDFGQGKMGVGQLVGVEGGGLKKGVRVEGVLRKLYETSATGVIVYGCKFKPVEGENV